MLQPEVVTNYVWRHRLELSLSLQMPPHMSKTLSYSVHATHFCFDVASFFPVSRRESQQWGEFSDSGNTRDGWDFLVETGQNATQRRNKNASCERCRKAFSTYELEAAFESWDLVLNDMYSLLQLLVVTWESEVLFSTKYRWICGENTHQKHTRWLSCPSKKRENDATSKQKSVVWTL